jgi:hypothetical protein
MAFEDIILLENSCEPKRVSRSYNFVFIVLYMKLICKGSFRLRVSTPFKIPLCAVQMTRVEALVRVRKSSSAGFFQRRLVSTLVDARSVSAEYVSHVFELGVDARQHSLV